jgi:ribosomal protein S27AE
VTTAQAFSVINGQLVQTNLDPTAALKEVVGTCPNCGQTSVQLPTHMDKSANVRYVCTVPNVGPTIEPAQTVTVPTNQRGNAPVKHR